MILKGSQRGGAMQMAAHLLNGTDNEHVSVHEVRGFIANDLKGALQEAYAVSQGTRCKQFMFSLSLSPPEKENAPVEVFENALSDVEEKLGLTDQPRVVVFHEKEGRRHAHCVWSRIDTDSMTAVNLPHFKLKLRDVSRELYLQHGWHMPRGLMDSRERDPTTFDRAEWQQAKRAGQDARALKALFQECWAVSDSRDAFANALRERGYWLARGDRRGHVAVDFTGEVYAVARWTGQKTKDVRARLGDEQALPSIAETKARIAEAITPTIRRHIRETKEEFQRKATLLAAIRVRMTRKHREERAKLRERQEARQKIEAKQRAERFSKGFRGLWERLTGKHAELRGQNEKDALRASHRDQSETDALIARQLTERQTLQERMRAQRSRQAGELLALRRELSRYGHEVAPESSVGKALDRAARLRTHFHNRGRGLER